MLHILLDIVKRMFSWVFDEKLAHILIAKICFFLFHIFQDRKRNPVPTYIYTSAYVVGIYFTGVIAVIIFSRIQCKTSLLLLLLFLFFFSLYLITLFKPKSGEKSSQGCWFTHTRSVLYTIRYLKSCKVCVLTIFFVKLIFG